MQASPPIGRALLAFGLCILAFSFAMEAKLAWYVPEHGLAIAVSATKALPADVPDLVQHGVSAPAPVFAALPVLLLLFAAPLWVAKLTQRLQRSLPYHPVSYAFCFSPQRFFRPPPSN
jgi:hypothetical protein